MARARRCGTGTTRRFDLLEEDIASGYLRLLLGLDGEEAPIRSALRRVGSLIRAMEERVGS